MVLPINVCIPCSDEYVKYVTVTIASICSNSRVDSIYIISERLSNDSLTLLKRTSETYNVPIVPIIFDISRLDWIKSDNRWPKFTMYFTIILDLFPNIDRILHLEVDTITVGDLSSLFECDLDGYCVAGCPIGFGVSQKANPCCFSYNDEDVNERRLNGGVLLFNLKYMRENNINEEYYKRRYIENNKYTATGEVLLSRTLDGKILYLNTVFYNYRTMYENGYRHRKYDLSQKKIVHFIDRRVVAQKPWIFDINEKEEYFVEPVDENTKTSICALYNLWWDYAKMVPNYLQLKNDMNARLDFYTYLKNTFLLTKK